MRCQPRLASPVLQRPRLLPRQVPCLACRASHRLARSPPSSLQAWQRRCCALPQSLPGDGRLRPCGVRLRQSGLPNWLCPSTARPDVRARPQAPDHGQQVLQHSLEQHFVPLHCELALPPAKPAQHRERAMLTVWPPRSQVPFRRQPDHRSVRLSRRPTLRCEWRTVRVLPRLDRAPAVPAALDLTPPLLPARARQDRIATRLALCGSLAPISRLSQRRRAAPEVVSQALPNGSPLQAEPPLLHLRRAR